MKRDGEKESVAVQIKSLPDEELLKVIKKACYEYQGDIALIESAIGALCWGRVVGWHGLRVAHASRTLRKYERILFVKFRDVLPPRTPHSTRMNGIRLADKLGKFWQVITAGLVSAKEGGEILGTVT